MMQAPILGILTGATCGDACWHAKEEVCRCSCGGANHGILRNGGDRPQRTAKIGGEFYELAAIIAGSDILALRDNARAAYKEVVADRFPGLNPWAYGEYREGGKFAPILERKISSVQERWPEVLAVKGARRLLWARPKGTRYAARGKDSFIVWKEAR